MKMKRIAVAASGLLALAATAGGLGLSGVASASSNSSTPTQVVSTTQGSTVDQGGNADVQVGDQSTVDTGASAGTEGTSSEATNGEASGTGTEVTTEADGLGGHQDANGVDTQFQSQQ